MEQVERATASFAVARFKRKHLLILTFLDNRLTEERLYEFYG